LQNSLLITIRDLDENDQPTRVDVLFRKTPYKYSYIDIERELERMEDLNWIYRLPYSELIRHEIH